MRTTIQPWQSLVPFYLFVACFLAPGCSCDPPAKTLVSATVPCISQDETVHAVRSTGVTTIVPGALPASLSFPESGGAALEIALDVAEGHGAPAISLTLDSSNLEDHGAGAGVSVKGVDSVTRCPRTMAMDGENRAVHFDKLDAFCAFGKRLVVTADLGDTIHYATWPSKTTGRTLLQLEYVYGSIAANVCATKNGFPGFHDDDCSNEVWP